MSDESSEIYSTEEVTDISELDSDVKSSSDSDFHLYDSSSEEEIDERGHYKLPNRISSVIESKPLKYEEKKKIVKKEQVKKTEPTKAKKIIVNRLPPKNNNNKKEVCTYNTSENKKITTAAKTIGGMWKN